MDLNYLYHRHGIALMLAAQARCDAARDAHRQLAAGYADQISTAIRVNADAAR